MTPFPSVDALVALVGPGRRPPPRVDWVAVQRAVGSVLPVDYRTLVDVLGPIAVAGFAGVFAPGCPNPNLDLLVQVGARLGALRELKQQEGEDACPYPLWFEPDGLLPWGATDNGDVLYWRTRGHPDQWTVVVGESRGPMFEEFPIPTADFLHALVEGRLASQVLPEDLGDDRTVVQVEDGAGEP